MKLVGVLLLVSLCLSSCFLQFTMADPTTVVAPTPSSCDSKCEVRCGSAGMKDRCMRYCGICCQECSCVPSGTYGNKSECPCYRDKLSSKGTPKCP
ncbi:peamaclein-like [Humulus lupulus]|uniref:peamaclein-like n=1 Tax=Humulus lupulus TaxID=3486 RepID=UPI002B40B265|nr:peamaclein-like [Humulus lupulus]